MGDPAAMTLMVASAIITVACCLAAGRSVPWQGRQSVIVMALAMIGMVVADGDPRISLLAGVALLVSAMLGTAGLRGATAVRACCHRALGSLVMAVCAFAGVAHGAEPVEVMSAHGAHLGTDAVAVAATVGVALLLAWTVADRLRPHPQRAAARLLAVESWAMTAGVVVMWAGH
ncbi:hypothetical protein KZC51_08170 [Microbacterium sp. SSW1-49]|uniref:DUF5134 domain-containing protein n=1 Tax=Microbacterium croceum TaxID=2851645 RepID=A0ABT0FDH5_9MICO|nr:hypothetical protein [Microbacterium croceum]MCK2036112.1 hypothetical protein [Microbacterium croceum]